MRRRSIPGSAVRNGLFSLAVGWVLHVTHSYSLLFAVSASAYLLALLAMQWRPGSNRLS